MSRRPHAWRMMTAAEYLAALEARQVGRRNAAHEAWQAAYAEPPGLLASLRMIWAAWVIARADRALLKLTHLRAVDLRKVGPGSWA